MPYCSRTLHYAVLFVRKSTWAPPPIASHRTHSIGVGGRCRRRRRRQAVLCVRPSRVVLCVEGRRRLPAMGAHVRRSWSSRLVRLRWVATRPGPSDGPPALIDFFRRPSIHVAMRILEQEDSADRGWAVFRHVIDCRLRPRVPFFHRVLQFCRRTAPGKAPDVIRAAIEQGVPVDGPAFCSYLGCCRRAGRRALLDDALALYRQVGPPAHNVICTLAGLCRDHGRPASALFLVEDALRQAVEFTDVLLSVLAACCAESGCTAGADTAERLLGLVACRRIPAHRNQQTFGNLVKALVAQGRCVQAAAVLPVMDSVRLVPDQHVYALVIGGLARQGTTAGIGRALAVFRSMTARGIDLHAPVLLTLVAACGHCSCVGALDEVGRVATAHPGVWHDDVYLVNAFLAAYHRCGRADVADALFRRVPAPDATTCNTMVSAYAKVGRVADALDLVRSMRSRAMRVHARVFASLVAAAAACAHGSSLDSLHALHRYALDAADGSLLDHAFVVSAFAAAFGRCLDEASLRQVHRHASARPHLVGDPSVTSALIAAYGQCGDADSAERVFSRSTLPYVDPSAFASVVAAYGRLARLPDLRRLHLYARRESLLPNVFVLNAFVAAFARCSDLSSIRALHAFARDADLLLTQPGVLGALVSAYGRCGDAGGAERVLNAYGNADPSAFASVVAAYGRLARRADVDRLCQEAARASLLSDAHVVSALVVAHARCSDLAAVRALHRVASTRALLANGRVASAVIAAYALCDRPEAAERAFVQAGGADAHPSAFAYVVAAYNRPDDIDRLHRYGERHGLLANGAVVSAFAGAYGRGGQRAALWRLRERAARVLTAPGVVNAFAAAHARCDDWASAERVVDDARAAAQVDPGTHADLIAAYARLGCLDRLALYAERHQALMSNAVVVGALAAAFGRCSALSSVAALHRFCRSTSMLSDVGVVAAFVGAYARCAHLDLAERAYRSLTGTPNPAAAAACNAMIGAYAHHGLLSAATATFAEAAGLAPDATTLLALLRACANAGDLPAATSILSQFASAWPHVQVDARHTACLVALYGRAGRLDEAERLAISAGRHAWVALLDACRQWSDVARAERALSALLSSPVPPADRHRVLPGAYALMDQVYAAVGRGRLHRGGALTDQVADPDRAAATSLVLPDRTVRFQSMDRLADASLERAYRRLLRDLTRHGYAPDPAVVTRRRGRRPVRLHSEKVALAYALTVQAAGAPIYATQRHRVCADCHDVLRRVSSVYGRDVHVRDPVRHHHFRNGQCSCARRPCR